MEFSCSNTSNPEIESSSSSESLSESSLVQQKNRTASLLSRLRAPTKSDLCRKRKIRLNLF